MFALSTVPLDEFAGEKEHVGCLSMDDLQLSCSELRRLGYRKSTMRLLGASCSELRLAGFSASQIIVSQFIFCHHAVINYKRHVYIVVLAGVTGYYD